ncbi:MAG: protein kinase [Candidatus Dormibacteraeota bacterium]|nr:protein kinase [Candidatus Dormibacteraeota bacterium]
MDDDALIGTKIRSYTVLECLGVGGFGSVYRVHHDDLDLDRALKVLHRSIATDAVQRERFLREARTTAKLRDPHIVPVYDVFDERGLLCIVEELISPSRTLAEDLRRRQGPLPRPELLRLAREIGEALDVAHGQGVVHRDVKPQNILLTMPSGQALLGDFGIARTTHDTGMTETGISLGTPTYMSPEQLGYGGGQVDGRSDDYSFALVLFEAATARQPYGTGNNAIAGHLGQKPLPRASQLNPALPASVDAVFARGLAREPAARYALASDLAGALAQAYTGQPASSWSPGASTPAPQPRPFWTGTGSGPTTPTYPGRSPAPAPTTSQVRPPVSGGVRVTTPPRPPQMTPPPLANSPSRGVPTPRPTGTYQSPAPRRRDPLLRTFMILGIILGAVLLVLIIIDAATGGL